MRTLFKNVSILFIFALLALGSVSSSQSASLLPARFVPGDETPGPAVNTQYQPAISQGSNGFLTVWADNRSNTTSGYEGETSYDIYGLLLDSTGTPLSPVPFPIAVGAATQENPKVAWNGTNYLVAYESTTLSGTGYYEKSIEAVRISPTGQVLDAQPIRLYGMRPSGFGWAMASDGNNWVIVNQGTSINNGILVVRISAAGVVLDPPNRTLVPATYYLRSNFKLVYANGVFLLTFSDSADTKGVRFDSSLNLLGSGLISLQNVPLVDLTSNGSEFYILWNQQLPNFTYPLYGSRVSTTGQLLDGAGVNLSNTNYPDAYTTTRVVWDGINWKTTWGFSNVVRVARINASGQVLDPGGVAVPGPETGLSAGTGNGGVQLIWSPYPNSSLEVQTANISPTNVAGANQMLSVGAPMQLYPDTATNGSGYMMVYESLTAANQRILAQPLDAAGNPLTTSPIELASASGLGAPAIAWNGSVYMVAWTTSTNVVALRLQADGTQLDPAPFTVTTTAFGPVDIEALGVNFLIVARKYGTTPQFIHTIAARVDGNGTVLDPNPKILGYVYASSPRVVTLGNKWFVAWQDNWSHDNPGASTLGVFIEANGTVGTNLSLHGPYSTAGGNFIFSLGLASNGNVALLVQSQELTSGVENDLLIRLINADGTVQPYVNITPWEGNQYRPRAAWDGTNFVIAYQDQKNRFTTSSLETLDARSDLFGMRISPTGTILDPQGFVFSNSPVGETNPNLIALNGTTLIAGSIMRNEAPFANYRVGYQLYGNGNPWPVAVANANQTSGNVPFTVNFSASGSSDPNGSIASYLWDFGDGTTSTQPNPSHLYTTAGNYVALLTVTDNQGAQTSETVAIRANNPNQVPVAIITASPMSGSAPLDVTFSAEQSYDPDGSVGNVEWTFHDGSSTYGPIGYYTYNQNGTYQVMVTVYDANGATGTNTISIVVGNTNPTPTPTPTQTPIPGGVMHIASIEMSVKPNGSSRFHAEALVTVVDASGLPVSGATVNGTFTGDSSNAPSGVTNASGQVTLASPIKRNGANWTFCVTNVTKGGWTYNAAANVETCDSTGSPTPTPTMTPTPTATPGAGNTLHVGDLDGASAPAGARWNATVVITVHDQAHNPVAGVTVSGLWSNGTSGSSSCVTNANGQCTVIKTNLRTTTNTVTFTITNATKAGFTYTSASNHDPDGDSTGTVIVIAKP